LNGVTLLDVRFVFVLIAPEQLQCGLKAVTIFFQFSLGKM